MIVQGRQSVVVKVPSSEATRRPKVRYCCAENVFEGLHVAQKDRDEHIAAIAICLGQIPSLHFERRRNSVIP
jgi:hypothetical protein